MGLDFSIEVAFCKKEDERDCEQIEIAYWRKCYTIRSDIMDLARYSVNFIDNDEDFKIKTKIEFLPTIMDYLFEKCKDKNSAVFLDSIWNKADCRDTTLSQLKRMNYWDNLFSRFPDILKEKDKEKRKLIIDEICYELIDGLSHDFEDKDRFVDIISNLEKYNVWIEIYNSY